MNPADCLTRPITLDKLRLWQQGKFQNFLELDENYWPEEIEMCSIDEEKIRPSLEEKPSPNIHTKRKKRSKIRSCAMSAEKIAQNIIPEDDKASIFKCNRILFIVVRSVICSGIFEV